MQQVSRDAQQLRSISLERNFTRYAEGSVLIKQGHTWVLCTASVEESVPPFLRGSGRGWITAEYGMLPRSTGERKARDAKRGRPDARGSEISRLIGRALRAATDLELLGERTITIDCDVIQADGGTRCAAITGGMVALCDAINWLRQKELLTTNPIRYLVAAVSVGICQGQPTLDLDYPLDSTADVDLNVVMTADGRYVEVQGTAEKTPFSADQFDALKELARQGIATLIEHQQKALAAVNR